jgi:hypothetical protein
MSEHLLNNSTYQQSNPGLESLKIAETFKNLSGNFHWRADYLKFCEVLGYTPDEWAENKYRQFQELIEALNQFDAESLAKMLDAGK